jgi:hypothetical protein
MDHTIWILPEAGAIAALLVASRPAIVAIECGE